MSHLTWRKPHVSIMDFVVMNNERSIPHQWICTITNVDNIASCIPLLSTEEVKFLRIADLPKVERPNVMKELSVMGITAGSLFPGFDATCEGLREGFFDL